MAGWTNLTPSAGALATGNAYLYESTGALMYPGTSGSAATLVNADGTKPANGFSITIPSGRYIKTGYFSGNTALVRYQLQFARPILLTPHFHPHRYRDRSRKRHSVNHESRYLRFRHRRPA